MVYLVTVEFSHDSLDDRQEVEDFVLEALEVAGAETVETQKVFRFVEGTNRKYEPIK